MPHHRSAISSSSEASEYGISETSQDSSITSYSSTTLASNQPNFLSQSGTSDPDHLGQRITPLRGKRRQEATPDPYEEYFIQQAKLFRHLEKRYTKFQKKQKEEQGRAKANKNQRFTPVPKSTHKQVVRTTHSENTKHPTVEKAYTDTNSSDSDTMIGSSVATIRGQAGRALSQAARPATFNGAVHPTASASFSSTAATSVRSQKLSPKKKKKVVNPDAMTASEAARVLRALEIANPTSSYSLTLSTKSTKSSLPIRGHFHLPLDPRRSSEVILVFAEPNSPSSNLAKAAGAAYVGGEELFEAVLSGRISPTRCLATPGMMPQVTRNLARYLGPKGLMPVAKRGLVGEGEELAEKIRDAAGRMEYRADKEGLVRIPVARMDFEIPSVENNIRSFIQTVRDNQSAGTTDDAVTAAAKKKKKGSSITAVRLETTNGPSIEINDVLQ
ncbi:mitochondrial 54S ribosomal uL1m domain-containing protein [Kwoniella dejecticola CBS 10117]|uniref:50S small subunit ribosomal protein L1 n=1 Tax=Kwoniella dejecticola CBS 10117 TaxID=1296121 RepID=A0A1A5ZW23_9TREE|nr:50S small subunit ribosomal protein L1 [Kwoniella dejecticola CBS 10117]OBR82007.1 50S small subunit ribosomal protein L1 [Kwoniella dejecticola CBS 10117]